MGTYDDGNWYAATLGQFISLLVDSGQDPAILFRVVEKSDTQEDKFIQHLEVLQLPDGSVVDAINSHNAEVHTTLVKLIKANIVH